MFCFLIHGKTTRKKLRQDSDGVLGLNAKCPKRGCGAACKLYEMRGYYHLYFIPLCPLGDPKPVVQCSHCQALFDLNAYQDFRRAAAAAVVAASEALSAAASLTAASSADVEVKDMLLRSENDAAERKIRALLKTDPNNINLMCYLNVALNGLGRAAEADKVASSVVYHWQTNCRSNWIAQGRPKKEAAFPRVMMNQATDEYRLEAKQFFEPESIGGESIALYKILAFPRGPTSTKPCMEEDKKLFKLIQTGTSFVLDEVMASGFRNEVLSYTDRQQPDIRKVTADVANFLTIPVATAEAMQEEDDGSVISEIASLNPHHVLV
jgi:hypothetical protein